MRHPRDKLLIERGRTMRNAPTEAEHKLWQALRHRGVAGAKFSRQIAVGPFIADFVCREARLIVELDGGHHVTSDDASRDRKLGALGYRVLRFTNREFFTNGSGVLETIAAHLVASVPPPGPLPAGEGEQEGTVRPRYSSLR